MFGHFIKMVSFKSQLCLSAWLQVIRAINHMLYSVDTTLLKLFKVKKVLHLSKVNQITTNQVLEVGLLTLKTFYTQEILSITKDQLRHTQLLSTLEVLSSLFHQRSTKLSKINGEAPWATLIAKQMLLSVKLEDHATKLQEVFLPLCSISRILFSKWSLLHIFIKEMEFVNSPLLWIH